MDRVVSAGRRHFERTFHAFLPFHIAEIEVEVTLLLIKLLAGVDDGRLESVGLGEELQHVGHCFHAHKTSRLFTTAASLTLALGTMRPLNFSALARIAMGNAPLMGCRWPSKLSSPTSI